MKLCKRQLCDKWGLAVNNDISYEVRPRVQAHHILKLFPLIVGRSFSHSTTRTEWRNDTFVPPKLHVCNARKEKGSPADKEICNYITHGWVSRSWVGVKGVSCIVFGKATIVCSVELCCTMMVVPETILRPCLEKHGSGGCLKLYGGMCWIWEGY